MKEDEEKRKKKKARTAQAAWFKMADCSQTRHAALITLHFFADIILTTSLAVAWFVRYKATDGQRTKLPRQTERACKVFFFSFLFFFVRSFGLFAVIYVVHRVA